MPGAFNVLLSHNPDVFPVAARQGYDLTIAGHTHGGQVRVEILRAGSEHRRDSYTPYVDGVYRKGASSIFVSRGIGTIGMPARAGRSSGGRAAAPVPYLILSDIHAQPGSARGGARRRARDTTTASCAWAIWSATAPIPTRLSNGRGTTSTAIVRGNHDKRAASGRLESHGDLQSRGAGFGAVDARRSAAGKSRLSGSACRAGRCLTKGFDLVHGSPADEDEYLVTHRTSCVRCSSYWERRSRFSATRTSRADS